jgi:hypothetical protein
LTSLEPFLPIHGSPSVEQPKKGSIHDS